MKIFFRSFWNKMESSFERNFTEFETRMGSDPEKELELNSEPISDSRRIVLFRIKFAIFHFLVYVICVRIILFYWQSAGCLEDPFLNSFAGKELDTNLYSRGFRFDFHVFLSENESNPDNNTQSIWTLRNLKYNNDDLDPPAFHFSTYVTISEVSGARIPK